MRDIRRLRHVRVLQQVEQVEAVRRAFREQPARRGRGAPPLRASCRSRVHPTTSGAGSRSARPTRSSSRTIRSTCRAARARPRRSDASRAAASGWSSPRRCRFIRPSVTIASCVALGFTSENIVPKKPFDAPSAKNWRWKPRGCVPCANSCALVRPSPSGSRAAIGQRRIEAHLRFPEVGHRVAVGVVASGSWPPRA